MNLANLCWPCFVGIIVIRGICLHKFLMIIEFVNGTASVGISRRKFPFENWESFATENRIQIVNWPIFEGQQRCQYFGAQALKNKDNFTLIYNALKSNESTRLKIRKVTEIEVEEGFRTWVTYRSCFSRAFLMFSSVPLMSYLALLLFHILALPRKC